MNRRTSFALDEETIRRLVKIARLLNISQAEVVRRSLEKMEHEVDTEAHVRLARLQDYHRKGGPNPAEVDRYLEEVAENRAFWGREE